jgi:4-carboxymuconolactone decarboxylase
MSRMSRLSPAGRDKIPQDQLGIYDELVRKGVPDHGVAVPLTHVPLVWRIDRDMRDYLRSGSTLSEDVVKLAILVTGRELDCQDIWSQHAGSAGQSGVPDGVMEALRDHKELPGLSDRHMTVIHYGREIHRKHHVSHGTFSRALELFGERGVVELGLLFGSYYLLAILLNSTDARIPSNRKTPALPVC